jgi:hypothetical protein
MDDDSVWKVWKLSFPLFEVQISANKQKQSTNKFEPALCSSSFWKDSLVPVSLGVGLNQVLSISNSHGPGSGTFFYKFKNL